MGMDLADKENTNPPLLEFCNCYKVANLTETILNPVNVSNLKDRYVLGEQLGWGQFGVIRVCSDKLTGERLACKSISKDRLVTQDDMKSIKLEIAIMAKLAGHPNVVDLKAVYEEKDYVHLVMELCAGGELFHKLEKYGKYSEVRARVLFKHLMQVVKFCHDNGIVHRDLKPENILMATMSSSSPIKLADFGLATYIKPGEKLSGTVGSPFYIAPEVLSGGYNEAADVWSAGVILYILLSGVPPFWGKTKSKIFDAVRAADLRFSAEPWDHITSYAKDLIRGMLCVDPSQRLSADDVLAHSWMEQLSESGQEQYDQDGFGCEGLENGGCSFSTQCVSREQDYSFSMGQLEQSTDNECKSSFSSFLPADNNTLPKSGFGGFSFDGELPESTSAGFSSTGVPSMPSFTFFSPNPATTQRNDIHENDGKLRDSSPKRLLHSLDCSSVLERREEAGENQTEAAGKSETRRERGNWSRISGLHSKRNRTIGLGELDQLVVDVAVTESIIRWASCTHIPTAPSLRLSLVC
uniref:non-specific serine/threonine protein kinase n=1 Tax=Noccaea caerulescens TaxID=107243 RepID=A0A1J3EQL6_NOCCA